ncbi:hypothetical protein D3C78_1786010 [compost metagenome]
MNMTTPEEHIGIHVFNQRASGMIHGILLYSVTGIAEDFRRISGAMTRLAQTIASDKNRKALAKLWLWLTR